MSVVSKEIIEIHSNPTLDEIWDLCVRNFLYDQKKYMDEILALFEKVGITKESRIADVSAGGGFPALNLIEIGYKVDCFDGFASDLFNQNARKQGQTSVCKQVLWKNLPQNTESGQYDFVFCRGNSFIFAGGGWNESNGFDIEKVQADYIRTAKIFADMLKEDGHLYIDKFKDDELGHREILATVKVGGKEQDLVFSSKRLPEVKTRQAFIQRMIGDEVINTDIRTTYDLLTDELVNFLKEGGFSKVNKINTDMTEERHFDVWLADR